MSTALAAVTLVTRPATGFLTSGPQFALLSAPQWAALVLVPVLALAAGLALVGRYERMLRRVWRDGAASSADS